MFKKKPAISAALFSLSLCGKRGQVSYQTLQSLFLAVWLCIRSRRRKTAPADILDLKCNKFSYFCFVKCKTVLCGNSRQTIEMVGGESAEIVARSRFKADTVTTYMSEL